MINFMIYMIDSSNMCYTSNAILTGTPIIAPLAKRPYQPYQADSPLKIDVFGREASGLFNQVMLSMIYF